MILDLDARELIEGDCHIRLSRLECAFIEALAHSPSGLNYDALMQSMWRGDEPDSAESGIGVVAHRVRQKLVKAGWRPLIGNLYGFGYRLALPVDIRTAGIASVVIPGGLRAMLESLLYSHPDRVRADRVLACVVGACGG
jgi:DNA-binding winged helix-turn-helix (wHTH) protein